MPAQFRFDSVTFEADQFRFTYELQTEDKTYHFQEHLRTPSFEQPLSQPITTRIGRALHLMLGISYWKIACPESIMHPYALTSEEAEFFQLLYTDGLGEFYYQNQIDFRQFQLFEPSNTPDLIEPIPVETQHQAVVGIGGGKDSLVSVELLREGNVPKHPFIVANQGQSVDLSAVLSVIGSPDLRFTRILDPQLTTISQQYRGHLPISAIYGLIGVIAAIGTASNAVVVSNEESANYGNTTYLGREINHQWSKTAIFEMAFRRFVHNVITSDITYVSLLRPFTEYRIAQLFSQYPQYYPVFSSCNRNFRTNLSENSSDDAASWEPKALSWCGQCAKCAFSFVLLAAHIPKETLIRIFGSNLLDDQSLMSTYQELLGIASIKPFDCVGTPDEVIVSFGTIIESGEYTNDAIVSYVAAEVLPKHPDWKETRAALLQRKSDETIPHLYLPVIAEL